MKPFLLLLAIAASCLAQQPTVWYQAEYMKVAGGNDAAYVKSESVIRPVHQDRVAKGQILSWSLYYVQFEGSKNEYNFVRVTTYREYAKIADPTFTDEQAKRMAELRVAGANSLRDRMKTDVWGQFALSGTLNAPWLSVNFIKSNRGMEQERQNDEAQRWKPIHDAQLKSGRRNYKGWFAASVMWPSGAGVEYDLISGDAYDAFGLPEEGGLEAEVAEANRNTALHGVTVRRELWQRVATTDPAK